MARKRQPNDLVDEFQAELSRSTLDWARIAGQVTSAALVKRVAVDAFVRAAIAFEGFRSDWHIAAITRDSSAFASFFTTKTHNALNAYPALRSYVRIELPRHPTLQLVSELLDPQGRNISLNSYSAWRDRASEHLADPWRERIVRMGSADQKLMDLVIALRDLVAHGSLSASNLVNQRLANLAARDARLRRGARRLSSAGAGAYLNAVAVAPVRRVDVIHERLREIAEHLRV